jgi:hypothetical protein
VSGWRLFVEVGHGLAIALDYGLEMGFFWRVHAPMTLSSQAGLALRAGQTGSALALLGRVLNWLSTGHTDAAILADIARNQAALLLLAGKSG